MTPSVLPSSAVTAPAGPWPAARDVTVGDSIGERRILLTRQDLVRYAGASGDLNPIHYSDHAAEAAGLPGVIAHGMLTMGAAAGLLVDWAGDPGAVLDYEVRFARPVRVPYPGSTELLVSGTIAHVNAEAGTVSIVLTVTQDGAKVLGKAKATVRLRG
jgi:acyl dehydratase